MEDLWIWICVCHVLINVVKNLAMQTSHALSSNVDGFLTGFASQTELITLGKRTYEKVLDIKKTPELRERYAFLKVKSLYWWYIFT